MTLPLRCAANFFVKLDILYNFIMSTLYVLPLLCFLSKIYLLPCVPAGLNHISFFISYMIIYKIFSLL
jgi:hypothetical protein